MIQIDDIYYEYSTGYFYELRDYNGSVYYTPLSHCSLEHSELI